MACLQLSAIVCCLQTQTCVNFAKEKPPKLWAILGPLLGQLRFRWPKDPVVRSQAPMPERSESLACLLWISRVVVQICSDRTLSWHVMTWVKWVERKTSIRCFKPFAHANLEVLARFNGVFCVGQFWNTVAVPAWTSLNLIRLPSCPTCIHMLHRTSSHRLCQITHSSAIVL